MKCPCGRRAIKGSSEYQRCEHQRRNGPKWEPRCSRCRDSGRIEMGGCDIPGCAHWMACECAKVVTGV